MRRYLYTETLGQSEYIFAIIVCCLLFVMALCRFLVTGFDELGDSVFKTVWRSGILFICLFVWGGGG